MGCSNKVKKDLIESQKIDRLSIKLKRIDFVDQKKIFYNQIHRPKIAASNVTLIPIETSCSQSDILKCQLTKKLILSDF